LRIRNSSSRIPRPLFNGGFRAPPPEGGKTQNPRDAGGVAGVRYLGVSAAPEGDCPAEDDPRNYAG
jgi:hypothetical protein